MDTMFQSPRHSTMSRKAFGGFALATAAVALGAATLAFAASAPAGSSDSAAETEVDSGGLTPHQIVIRGEVADRYSPTATGLTPHQIVIRGEVADRYATDAAR